MPASTIGRSLRELRSREGAGTVILRLIRGRASRGQRDAFRDALVATLRPADAQPPGLLRWHLGTRGEADDLEVLALAAWQSAEDVAAADAHGTTAWRLAQQHIDNPIIEHFEVDEPILRSSDREPIAIRVATGRFSHPGTDIQMQNLLRERLPSIGDEMTEAYVGRRLAGPAIEVTFVSLWRQHPEGLPLEAPFWPDIALRYDAFSVEVYTTVG